jgi:hypothetical protein
MHMTLAMKASPPFSFEIDQAIRELLEAATHLEFILTLCTGLQSF